jgi:hypothetical protein
VRISYQLPNILVVKEGYEYGEQLQDDPTLSDYTYIVAGCSERKFGAVDD